jgi:hypothetical protein
MVAVAVAVVVAVVAAMVAVTAEVLVAWIMGVADDHPTDACERSIALTMAASRTRSSTAPFVARRPPRTWCAAPLATRPTTSGA